MASRRTSHEQHSNSNISASKFNLYEFAIDKADEFYNRLTTHNSTRFLSCDELALSNPRHSFAPVRCNSKVVWYVDGKDYYHALSEQIERAQYEIYIMDWFLSPEVYLRRPYQENEEYRLDRLLKRVASRGVKIYVLLYAEVPQALPLNSENAREKLESLHPNILVQRHPDHFAILHSTWYWAHHEKICLIDQEMAFMGGVDLCFGRYDTHAHPLSDAKAEHFPGLDYHNERISDFKDVQFYQQTIIERQRQSRMPWHDISLCVLGDPVVDLATHFLDRWNFVKRTKNMTKKNIPILDTDVKYQADVGEMQCQVLRSSGSWSMGLDETECSIQNAYIEAIERSEHFIYIENQFFITSSSTNPADSNDVKNLIGKALVDRIIRAHQEKADFKVVILIPLVPSFPGDLSSEQAGTARIVMAWQYKSICRGPNSIYGKLIEAGIEDPKHYISFYSLRTHDKIVSSLNKSETDSFVTELVYIHAKMMIVDDRVVIIGSANINDRSQLGKRDSEIAIRIQDKDMIASKMNNHEYFVSKFATSLRRFLMQEHLGLLDKLSDSAFSGSPRESTDQVGLLASFTNLATNFIKHSIDSIASSAGSLVSTRRTSSVPKLNSKIEYDFGTEADEIVSDPLSLEFQKYFDVIAKKNTGVYRDVFHVVPDDSVHNWDDYHNFFDTKPDNVGHVYTDTIRKDYTVQEIEGKLATVHGHLVEFPLNFLQNEDLLEDKSWVMKAATEFIMDVYM